MLRVGSRSKSEGRSPEVSECRHPSPSPEAQERLAQRWETGTLRSPFFPRVTFSAGARRLPRQTRPLRWPRRPEPARRSDRKSGGEEVCPPRQVGALLPLRSSRPKEMRRQRPGCPFSHSPFHLPSALRLVAQRIWSESPFGRDGNSTPRLQRRKLRPRQREERQL